MSRQQQQTRDYYEILQIHERAIPEVVEKVYRVLVRKYHPDVHPPEKTQWAEQMMKELNIAYSVISDARKRAEYDAQRRLANAAGVAAPDLGDVGVTKCFNHPKRPSTAFCFWCGRPICELCLSPNETHPRCTTCERYAEAMAKEPPEQPPHGAWPRLDRPMGALGVIGYYGILVLLVAGIAAVATALADALHADARHVYMVLVVLGVLFALAMLRELTWRVVCPACHRASGRVSFRAHSPWRQFFAPSQACVGCGHWFTAEEMRDAFR